jgi:serine protease Do
MLRATTLTGFVPVVLALALSGGMAAAAVPLQAQPVGPAGDVSALVTSVQPAVVNITVEQGRGQSSEATPDDESPLEEFFRQFHGHGAMPTPEGKRVGAGSGFVIDDKGHVVTNAHVVDGAETVKVKLSDERELNAKVLGTDERLDVAVLQIVGATNLPHVSLGSSAALKVGEPVVAIGNPFGLGGTVTTGIVSAKSRSIGAGPYDDFIQTDASINPGNSGGPLFDLRGQVVGMNTAISANGQGIGFAIPADAIRAVLPQLIEHGHVRRGRLGAVIQGVDEPLAKAMGLANTHGALVGDVETGGPAAAAGLRSGDVIVAVNGAPVAHAHDLPRMIGTFAPGARVTLEARRGGSTVNIPVTLAEIQEEKPTQGPKAQHQQQPATGAFGLDLGDVQGKGALVRRIAPTSPALGALASGDIIVEVEHQPVRSAAEARAKMQGAPGNKPILLRVEHDGSTRWVAVERPR